VPGRLPLAFTLSVALVVGVAFFSPLKHGLLLGKYDKPVAFEEGDFRLEGYDPHPHIKAPVSV